MSTLFTLASVCDTLRERREGGHFREPLKKYFVIFVVLVLQQGQVILAN